MPKNGLEAQKKINDVRIETELEEGDREQKIKELEEERDIALAGLAEDMAGRSNFEGDKMTIQQRFNNRRSDLEKESDLGFKYW